MPTWYSIYGYTPFSGENSSLVLKSLQKGILQSSDTQKK